MSPPAWEDLPSAIRSWSPRPRLLETSSVEEDEVSDRKCVCLQV